MKDPVSTSVEASPTRVDTPVPWLAPAAAGELDAVVRLPGSKSLTARALLLAALADSPTTLTGVLRSRDTDLMRAALETFGARFESLSEDATAVRVVPAPVPLRVRTTASAASVSPGAASQSPVPGRPIPSARIDCGLAGTVMRFVPPLAALADAPVLFDGDDGARLRPLGPLLDSLTQLGAGLTYLGRQGHLPVVVTPAPVRPHSAAATAPVGQAPAESVPGVLTTHVDVDASGSSQFLSALLLVGPLLPGGLSVTPTGPVPSLPHVAMTVASLRERGIGVVEPEPQAPDGERSWLVAPGRPRGGEVAIEPDLSNAGPFLAAALVSGGRVSVPDWPAQTTQAGDAWRSLLPRLGGRVSTTNQPEGSLLLTASGTGRLCGIDADLSAVGELAPTVAALALLASAQGHASRLRGIAHLRGHETDRLAALVTEMRRVGGVARQTQDGIEVDALPDGAGLHPAELRAYADHRMATFAAVVGLGLPGTMLDDVACTSKTLPDFPGLWSQVLAQAGAPASVPGADEPRPLPLGSDRLAPDAEEEP
ncbi:3-phosphoshikimate 1-carboxyvinyltransferase [Actinomyces faecalis]|uniref:3-phosphoshikimate 1-carboxyvinyltransferase n=1 Tax=Actinomyces faecalis TaxID=2722820 RepID=UPI001FD331EE|nr:3-phosphoshikimate 1-carboxyvinyltransferase [Actinomyces faecalis]